MNSNQNLHGRAGSGAPPYERDREMDDRQRAMQQHEEMARRDQERERERERDREAADRFQSTHQSSAGSIPIHQPVASRISGAIHSPGGLLANHNGNPPSMPIGGPPGPYGGPPQGEHRPMQHGGQGANAQHQGYGPISHSQPPSSGPQTAPSGSSAAFGGPLQGQPQDGQRPGQQAPAIANAPPGGPQIPGGITQGQQPILNVSV